MRSFLAPKESVPVHGIQRLDAADPLAVDLTREGLAALSQAPVVQTANGLDPFPGLRVFTGGCKDQVAGKKLVAVVVENEWHYRCVEAHKDPATELALQGEHFSELLQVHGSQGLGVVWSPALRGFGGIRPGENEHAEDHERTSKQENLQQLGATFRHTGRCRGLVDGPLKGMLLQGRDSSCR